MKRLERIASGKRGRRGRRAPNSRRLRKRFLIVCEGEVTEVEYFRAFPVSSEVQVAVRGEGKNTRSLVSAAERHADEGRFDEVWVVYDHDDFGAEKFNQAAADIEQLDRTREESWRAAWSNQAFELWYLLHFQFFDGQLHRHLVNDKLSELMTSARGRAYAKNDPSMYEALLMFQSEAVERAKRLVRTHDEAERLTPASRNPCTMVFQLVQALNAEIP